VDAAQDSAALVARREVCRALATGFEQLGDSLLVHGHLFGPQRVDGTSPTGNGDDRLVALGYLSKTAGALIRGALSLTLAGNCYASSALNRQLVEVEYLAWAFVEDQEEASNWLRSSNQQRLDRGNPDISDSALKGGSGVPTTATTARQAATRHQTECGSCCRATRS